MRLTKEKCPLKTREEVERILEEVFSGQDYKIESDIYHPDGRIELEISYTDFIPIEYVRKLFEQCLPEAQLALHRDYTKSVVKDAMREMYENLIDVWTYDYEGRPVRLCINYLVEAWLSNKEVRNGVAIYGLLTMEDLVKEENDE